MDSLPERIVALKEIATRNMVAAYNDQTLCREDARTVLDLIAAYDAALAALEASHRERDNLLTAARKTKG